MGQALVTCLLALWVPWFKWEEFEEDFVFNAIWVELIVFLQNECIANVGSSLGLKFRTPVCHYFQKFCYGV
jgi:hypothetical protein